MADHAEWTHDFVRPATTKRSVAIIAGSIAAVVAVVTAGVLLLGHSDPTPTASAPSSTASPKAGPTPLYGLYRVDMDLSQSTFRFSSPRLSGIQTATWAFQPSSCQTAPCDIKGAKVDLATGRRTGDIAPLTYRNGRWETAAPMTAQNPCTSGPPGMQSATIELWFQPPLPDGGLRGMQTITATDGPCVERGDVIMTPIVGTLIGSVPTGVLP